MKEIWAGGGAERWEGVCPTLLRRLRETSSEAARQGYQELLVDAPCPACGGSRLRPESRAVRLGGRSLPELQELPATEVLHLLTHLALTPTDATIAAELLTETRARLSFLCDLGLGCPELGYVSLTELTGFRGPLGLAIERDRHFVASRTLTEYAAEAHRAGRIRA